MTVPTVRLRGSQKESSEETERAYGEGEGDRDGQVDGGESLSMDCEFRVAVLFVCVFEGRNTASSPIVSDKVPFLELKGLL